MRTAPCGPGFSVVKLLTQGWLSVVSRWIGGWSEGIATAGGPPGSLWLHLASGGAVSRGGDDDSPADDAARRDGDEPLDHESPDDEETPNDDDDNDPSPAQRDDHDASSEEETGSSYGSTTDHDDSTDLHAAAAPSPSTRGLRGWFKGLFQGEDPRLDDEPLTGPTPPDENWGGDGPASHAHHIESGSAPAADESQRWQRQIADGEREVSELLRRLRANENELIASKAARRLAESERERQREQIEELEGRLANLEAQGTRQLQTLARSEQRQQELTESLLEAQLASRNAQSALDDAEERSDARLRQQLQAEREASTVRVADLEQRLKAAESETENALASLEQSQSSSATDMSETLAALDQLREQMTAAEGQLNRSSLRERELAETLEKTREERSRERGQAQRTIAEQQQQLQALGRERAALSEAVSQKAAVAEELTGKLRQRGEEAVRFEKTVLELRQAIAERDNQLQRAVEAAKARDDALTDARTELRRRQQELETTRREAQGLTSERETREREYVTLRGRLETELGELKTQMEDRGRREAFLQDSVEKAEERQLELEDKLREAARLLDGRTQQFREQYALKEEAYRKAKTTLDAREAELKVAADEYNERDLTRATEIERLDQRVKEKDAQVNELLHLMESRTEAQKKAESQTAELGERLAASERRQHALQERAKQMSQMLEERTSRITQLEGRLKQATEEREAGENRHKLLARELQARAARVAELEAGAKDFETTRIGLEQRARSLAEELEERLQPMASEIQTQAHRIAVLEDELKDARALRAGLEQRARTLSTQIEEKSDRIAELEMVLLEAQTDDSVLHASPWHKNEEETTALRTELEERTEQLAELKREVERLQSQTFAKSQASDGDEPVPADWAEEIAGLRAENQRLTERLETSVSGEIGAEGDLHDLFAASRSLPNASIEQSLRLGAEDEATQRGRRLTPRLGLGMLALLAAALVVLFNRQLPDWWPLGTSTGIGLDRTARHGELQPASSADTESALELLRAWSRSVEQRDLPNLLSLYAPTYHPPRHPNRKAFEQELMQTLRTADWLAADIDHAEVQRAATGMLVVSFPITIRAGGHTDVGHRRLWLSQDGAALHIQDDDWRP